MSLVELFAFLALAAGPSGEGSAWMMAEIAATDFPSFDSFAASCSDAVEAFADLDSSDNSAVAFHFAGDALVDVDAVAGDNFDLDLEPVVAADCLGSVPASFAVVDLVASFLAHVFAV